MKTKLLIVPLIALLLSAFAFGSAAAQGPQPPADPTTGTGRMGGRGMRGGMMASDQTGLLHDYLTAALADELGLTVGQVAEDLAAGSTLYDIALENGILAADIPTLLADVHTAAFQQAVADGILTAEQAEWMSQRMARTGYGYGDGIPAGTTPQDGTGFAHGRGSNTSRGQCLTP